MNSFFGRQSDAKSRSQNKTVSRLMMTSAIVAVGSFAAIPTAIAADIELPVFGSLGGGNATVTTNAALDKMDITQTTNRVIINWNTFNIGADATVQFYQQSANDLAVNRVSNDGQFSRINGRLIANGKVMILDPNGVMFGAGSMIDVGAIVASTGDINASRVMAGDLVLKLTNFGTGQIINAGTITALDSGLVALVGPTVKNSGVINASLGRVSLAAGNESATVDLYGDGLVSLAYTDKNDNLLSENTGEINAVGGTIQMTSAAAKDVVDSVVNMNGIAKANSAIVTNGKIILSAKKVKVGSGAVVKGKTNVNAKSVDLAATIDGPVSGSSMEVNVQSNAAKIAQALDIISNNGTINVGAGTYNEHIVVNKSGVYLKGAKAGLEGYNAARGSGESIIIPNSPGITIAANNVTVDGFTITGATGLDGYGIFVDNASNATIKYNIIKNNSQDGIFLNKSFNSTISYNLITDTGRHGIYAKGSKDLDILANQIGVKKGGKFNINGDGILLEASHDAYIYNNRIANTTSTANDVGNGIHVQVSNNADIRQNSIYNVDWDGVRISKSNNTKVYNSDIHHAKRVGVYATFSKDTNILNNQIDNTLLRGIMVEKMSGPSLIKGNKIDLSSIDGITIHRSNDVTVEDNEIGYGFDGSFNTPDGKINAHGINITDSGNVKVKGNKIAHTGGKGVSANNVTGLVIGGASTKSDRNIINFTGDSGVHVVNSASALIAGNKIGLLGGANNIKGDGVYLEGSNGSNIESNSISNTKSTANDIGSGIHIMNSSNVFAGYNIISTNGWDGIKITAGDNVRAYLNNIDQVARVGIFAKNGSNLDVSENDIFDASIAGIMIQDMSGLSNISSNEIDKIALNKKAGLDGIYVLRSNNTQVLNNIIGYGEDGLLGTDDTKIKRDGIRIQSSSNVDVLNNKIVNAGANGIHAIDVSGLIQINGNTINSSAANGILVDGYAPGTIIILSKKIAELTEGDDSSEESKPIGLYVNRNIITDSKDDGIELVDVSGKVRVRGNKIDNSGTTSGNGIYIHSSSKPIYASYKSLYSAPLDLLVKVNVVSDSVQNGIYISGISGDIRVKKNNVSNSGTSVSATIGDGIKVENVNNDVVFYDGPYLDRMVTLEEGSDIVDPVNQLLISGNTVQNSSGNGIGVYNVGGKITIKKNDISDSGKNGIFVGNNMMVGYPDYAETMMAEVYYPYPIYSTSVDLLIANNDIINSDFNGISVENLNGDIRILTNDITDSSSNGISASYINNANMFPIFASLDVSLEDVIVDPDYPTNLGSQLIIDGNTIDNSGRNGIDLYNVGGLARVSRNIITDSGDNGIYAYNSDYSYFDLPGDEEYLSEVRRPYPESNPISLYIIDNTIENLTVVSEPDEESMDARISKKEDKGGFAAINLNIGSQGYAKIAGNQMTGPDFQYGLYANSGRIDLTGRTNTITDTNIGMGFYPDSSETYDSPEYFDFLADRLSLVGDTIGTTAFVDQSELFVDLGYGAFFAPGTPTILNGNDATYTLGSSVIAPSANGGFVTQAEYDTLESRINHYNDIQNRGLFFFTVFPDQQTIDQSDVFRTFDFLGGPQNGGTLTVTGLPSIGGLARVGNVPFNPNLIEPAAGDEEGTGNNIAGIEPASGSASGNDTSCWADATQSLGQGTAVMFNFGAGSSALLQDAVTCGTGSAPAQGI